MNYFDEPDSKYFSFESFADGLDETTFAVINFTGTEAISSLYEFEIMLLSSNREIDLEDVLQAQAVFTIHRGGDDDVLYNGILAEFEQLHEVNDVIFYRAKLVPRLWWLNLTHHNQVFLEMSVPDIIEEALRDGGMESEDFDVSGLSGYEELSYSCQYDESHFNYVSRLMERQGIYYYYLQEDDGEVLVLTDTKFSHEGLKEGAELFYNPASGLEGHHLGESIGAFSCRQKQLPAEIILKDYNYEKPSLDITSTAEVDPVGRGVTFLYGEYFATPEEGERFAGIRAEELLCQKQVFHGKSTVPYMMPGFTFSLNNHYREDFNQEYLVMEVRHEGNQSSMLSSGIAFDSSEGQNQAIYSNSFTVIPADTQYRPLRETVKPKISGTIHAKIDSEIDSDYAQVDEQGRYRVKLPFDINDEHLDGKGSAPVRMMQPYAGKDRGMQFPLVKGTEVLLTFIEGNPDRPVIAGAVSNPETRGPVNAENQSESVIQTGGANRIRMQDQNGKQRMVFETPASNTWVRLGAHNDPIIMDGAGVIHVESGDDTWTDPGAKTADTTQPTKDDNSNAPNQQAETIYIDVEPVIKDSSGNVVDDIATMVQTDGVYTFTYTVTNPNTSTDDVAIRTVIVGDTTEQILGDDTNGIRLHSAGDLWSEARGRMGRYVGSIPTADAAPRSASSDDPKQTGDLIDLFANSFAPTGMIPYHANSNGNRTVFSSLTDAIEDEESEMTVSSINTFNTQEGNIYDFGGYWNYNLGNSYEENFMLQASDDDNDDDTKEDGNTEDPALNGSSHKGDLLSPGGPHWTSLSWPTATPPNNNQDWSFDGGVTIDNDLDASDTRLQVNGSDSRDYNNSGSRTLWVSKSFGDTYEYYKGNQISVAVGSSLDVQHGGRHVEVNYRGDGSISSWSHSESGVSKEKKWTSRGTLISESTETATDAYFRDESRTYDRNTGDLCTYSTSQGTGMGNASFDFDYTNQTSAAFNFGLVVSAEVWGGMKIESETYLGGQIKNENFIGIKFVNENLTGTSVKLELAAAGVIEIKNTKLEANFPGTRIKAFTAELETKASTLKAIGTSLTSKGGNIQAKLSDIEGIGSVKLTA